MREERLGGAGGTSGWSQHNRDLKRVHAAVAFGAGIKRDASRPVDAKALVVDETSMVDVTMADALLQAPKGQLNVKGAIQVLAAHDDGAIVQVHDGANEVKVWIDSKAEADI